MLYGKKRTLSPFSLGFLKTLTKDPWEHNLGIIYLNMGESRKTRDLQSPHQTPHWMVRRGSSPLLGECINHRIVKIRKDLQDHLVQLFPYHLYFPMPFISEVIKDYSVANNMGNQPCLCNFSKTSQLRDRKYIYHFSAVVSIWFSRPCPEEPSICMHCNNIF